MSFFRPRNVAIAGGGLAAAIIFFPRTTSQAPLPDTSNIFETPGVKNIGDAHARGGASNTHTTAVATTRGKHDDTVAKHEQPKGVDTPYFQEKQAEQKVGEPTIVGKAWHKAHYGENNTKGK
ncbi:hypothetical protein Tdes44962_MAKER01471 [Teratosphaeria destructans]|uniref:Uncharacterized protein n=1 Tax=Teratosphaeria destructans TaxID=418781 RepID=A0A9W7SZG9_9PEZI|nr:hypothetical protein Tdes44962_MAKER01471 [Teratosphaeria destructans]